MGGKIKTKQVKKERKTHTEEKMNVKIAKQHGITRKRNG